MIKLKFVLQMRKISTFSIPNEAVLKSKTASFTYFFTYASCSGRSLSLSSLDGEKIPKTPLNPTVITML